MEDKEESLTSRHLSAWAEVSARLGSGLLEGVYAKDFGDKIVVTRIPDALGGSEFIFEPYVETYVEPKPQYMMFGWLRSRPWLVRLAERLGLQ